MAKFEKIKQYENVNLPLPVRKTAQSAGYDFVVAEDIIVPPYQAQYNEIERHNQTNLTYTLEEAAAAIKEANAKITLVPTGMKCKLEPDTYLELSVRSSCPLKHWLILANGVGKQK